MSFTSVNLNLWPPGSGKHISLLLTPSVCAPLFAPRCRNNRLLMDTEAASFFLRKNGCAEVGGTRISSGFFKHVIPLFRGLHYTVTKTGNTDMWWWGGGRDGAGTK